MKDGLPCFYHRQLRLLSALPESMYVARIQRNIVTAIQILTQIPVAGRLLGNRRQHFEGAANR